MTPLVHPVGLSTMTRPPSDGLPLCEQPVRWPPPPAAGLLPHPSPTSVAVTVSSLNALRLLVLLGLLFQLSTLLLMLAGPVPPQPLASTNTVFRPDAATDTGEAPPVTPLSER